MELCTQTCANGGTLDVINCINVPLIHAKTMKHATIYFLDLGICMCAVGYTGMTCEVCTTGYVMESGQCGKHSHAFHSVIVNLI